MIQEYGNIEQEKLKAEATVVEKVDESTALGASKDSDKEQPDLMQQEERVTGSVTWKIYGTYLRYSGGLAWAPLILLLTGLMQGAQGSYRLMMEWSMYSRAFLQSRTTFSSDTGLLRVSRVSPNLTTWVHMLLLALELPSSLSVSVTPWCECLPVSRTQHDLIVEIYASRLSLAAGYGMFRKAFTNVMHSPVSFFDTTPIGKFYNRKFRLRVV